MESTVKRHEKIRDFILYEVMVARFTAYHCVCMQMQQTQKLLSSSFNVVTISLDGSCKINYFW